MSRRCPWDFDYAPIAIGHVDIGGAERDLVLATDDDVDAAQVAEALGPVLSNLAVTPLFSGHPVFWTRIQSTGPIDRKQLVECLRSAGVHVRYVASATRGSQRLPPSLVLAGARARRPSDWQVRPARDISDAEAPWRWFLRREGIDVSRDLCGTGARTRLAVIDNDGRELDKVDLDAEVLVGVGAVPRAAAHAALLIGWCVGARTMQGTLFHGVAPDASPRLYCIPKAAADVVSLPLAILRAVDDGADVVVCATSVEGQTSPLLDDALEFASRLGRGGRGTPVVMPTGREMSSPPGSVHSSLSLGLADPASDPRVFCIGPSSRGGDWFLWRDRQGKLRPFANRGPSVRWLAPGDDMAYPFDRDDRPAHAESSGASAIAAGVLLLLMEQNSELELSELDGLLTATVKKIEGGRKRAEHLIADTADLRPDGIDADGHNPKHGYGCLDATAACVSACDPFASALIRVGERAAGREFGRARQESFLKGLYSRELAGWTARKMISNATLQHAFASLVRAVRLAETHPERFRQQPTGHLLRQLGAILSLLERDDLPLTLASEVEALRSRLRIVLADQRLASDAERAVLEVATRVFVERGERDGVDGLVALPSCASSAGYS